MTAVAPAFNTLVDTRTGQAIDLAMQSLSVEGRVYPLGSFIRVTHRFKCMGTGPMEAIYVSMLPSNGTLRRFKVRGENFEADSKLEKRQKALQEYEEGIAQGHLSVLAESNQDGLVHLSVGQVQPDEEISVIMDVVVGVDTKDDGFRFRFPFTLAPSYHPQAKSTATEAGGTIELPSDVFGDLVLPEWKSSGFGLHEIGFKLRVYGGSELASVSSPSHRIAFAPQKDGSTEVSLAGMGDTPNRDLVLEVKVPEATPTIFADATLLGTKATGNEPAVPQDASRWTALLPSTKVPKVKAPSRKVCFVIDRSGSMTGSRNYDPHAPILKAKQALLACLSALRPTDEFGIVHFGSDAVSFDAKLGLADDANRKRATAFVDGIQCHGGTEMLKALAAATRVLGGPGGDIFLITDGEVWQTGPIVEHMAASGSRVHVLGIGTASQHRFMAQLSRRTGGVQDVVSPMEDVGMTGLSLFNKVREPRLIEATAKVDGVDLARKLGTVWDGVPVLINDPKGDGSLPGTILIDGKGAKAKAVKKFAKVPVPDGLIALLWAGRRIEDLSSKLDMAQAGPMKDTIEQKMEDISVAYSLASRVMSLVAVVERLGDQAGVTPEQKVVATGMPEGQDPAGVFPASTSHVSILNAAPAAAGGGGILRGGGFPGGLYAPPGVFTMTTVESSSGGDGGGDGARLLASTGRVSYDRSKSRGFDRGGGIIRRRRRSSVSAQDYSADITIRSLESTTGSPLVEETLTASNLVSFDGNDTGGGNFYSPELSLDSLDEPGSVADPIDLSAVVPGSGGPAALIAGAVPAEIAAAIAGLIKPFYLSESLLIDLAGIQADGGVLGKDLEDRVLRSLLFALLLFAESKATPGVFEQHIIRLAEFLKANLKSVSGRKVVILKVAKLVTNGAEPPMDAAAVQEQFAKIGAWKPQPSDVWEAVAVAV